MNTMIKIFTNYSEYIKERQNFNPNAWRLYEDLIDKWRKFANK